MYRILLCILLLGTTLALPAQTNKKIRSLQREQTSLKKKIANQEHMLKSTKKDVNSQLANLQVINVQIEGQQKYVNGIHAELTEVATTISGLERQLKLLEADLAVCKRRYQRSVSYIFHNRMQVSKWQFILSAKNFKQMYRRLRYLSSFSRYQRAQAEIIRQKEAQVQAKRNELLGVKTEKNRLLREGQAEQRKLQGQQQERQQVVNELNKRQAELQASIAQQRKKAAALDARIDQLIQQEIAAAERRRKAELARQAKLKAQREQAKREQAEAKRKATAAANAKKAAAENGAKTNNAGTKTTASGNTRSNTKRNATKTGTKPWHTYTKPVETSTAPEFAESNADRAINNSFAGSRGRLPMPITGSYAITRHYGSYSVAGLKGVQLDSKGINITGHPGAQARAVYKGEVTAIFTVGGLYNIIVRHGSYMSVYCNLSSTSVRRGQNVQAGQTLGTVATDASGNSTLHFQLRKETARLNPEAWLGR
ncbi:peptidoglycan DD-metalloendopeptidase family protein [Prevotellamassilia timonensis]|uniref:murein hydrolase activator EnvC family protein n=1 Tax=Prevotellamassilia timonensis TaxID=1852370 RepID=UPI0023F17EB7|nr:peptidoglycan DD-metalloendopeptidase family protein [Prevotellamassilia timonensis]MDD7440962.1 peptidoglycan DD-metalloendopeptidase family protein [Prevotellamassilia timonensis]